MPLSTHNVHYSLSSYSLPLRNLARMDMRAAVGRNILRYRRERDISQEELAFRSKSSRAYISGLEAGKRNPTILSLVKFATALEVSVEDLIHNPPLDHNQPAGR